VKIGADDYIEVQQQNAPRELTNDLYHYTGLETGVFGILRSGVLRLSPFAATNDLWESRPLNPALSTHYDDTDLRQDPQFVFLLWAELDRNIRLHTKVACLTQDWRLPEDLIEPDAERGWAHLSLWAHYGAGHTGICLRFDKSKLIAAFEVAPWNDALRFHDTVHYWRSARTPRDNSVDLGQLREFGPDAVGLRFATVNKDSIFFSKHADWSNESEYRLILLDQSVLPVELDIRSALTGVFLGEAFPEWRWPALQAALADYSNVAVLQVGFQGRRLFAFPPAPAEQSAWGVPARTGSVMARLDQLAQAESDAAKARESGQPRVEAIQLALVNSVSGAMAPLGRWPDVQIERFGGMSAIPQSLMARRAGVPGEIVHAQVGVTAVARRPAFHWPALIASAAVQALPDGKLRLHARVWTEAGGEVPATERLTTSHEVPDQAALGGCVVLAEELSRGVTDLLADFRSLLDAAAQPS
jgi:hypothetical protein